MTERKVTAFAPASIGNLGVGFDLLGLAIAGAGDHVTAELRDEPGVGIRSITDSSGEPLPDLSTDAERNTASIAAAAVWTSAQAEGGLWLDIRKGVPLQSGMGSSAASAVAGAVAANALLDKAFPNEALLPFALAGESFASGAAHADNVAPSLLGGLVLCVPGGGMVSIPVPDSVSSVLLHPELRVNTAESRRGLSKSVTRGEWVEQQGYLAGFVSACFTSNIDLMRDCLRDIIIEPQRAASVPCFDAVSRAAREYGVIGCSLSGSGPSIFALVENEHAQAVADRMQDVCAGQGVESEVWISSMSAPGASVKT